MEDRALVANYNSYEIGQDLNNRKGLLFFEQQVIIAAQDWEDVKTRFAYHLSIILENKLYLHHKDELNHPLYPTQIEYLRYLDQETGKAISTMKRYFGGVRFFRAIGYDSPELLDEVGIQVVTDVYDAFDTDRETAAPRALKSGTIPKGQSAEQYARYCVQELSSTRNGSEFKLRRGDYAKRKAQLLSPNKPNIKFELYEDGTRQWVLEQYDEEGMMSRFESGVLQVLDKEDGVYIHFGSDDTTGQVPVEVRDYAINKLKL